MIAFVIKLTRELDPVVLMRHAVEGTDPPWGYVEFFDPDAHGGPGAIKLTSNRRLARRFASKGDAFEAWRQQSSVKPLRPDGKPNRPMTAFSIVDIEEVEQ